MDELGESLPSKSTFLRTSTLIPESTYEPNSPHKKNFLKKGSRKEPSALNRGNSPERTRSTSPNVFFGEKDLQNQTIGNLEDSDWFRQISKKEERELDEFELLEQQAGLLDLDPDFNPPLVTTSSILPKNASFLQSRTWGKTTQPDFGVSEDITDQKFQTPPPSLNNEQDKVGSFKRSQKLNSNVPDPASTTLSGRTPSPLIFTTPSNSKTFEEMSQSKITQDCKKDLTSSSQQNSAPPSNPSASRLPQSRSRSNPRERRERGSSSDPLQPLSVSATSTPTSTSTPSLTSPGLLAKVRELEEEMETFKRENEALAKLRREAEERKKELDEERASLQQWTADEKQKVEKWCQEKKKAADRELRMAEKTAREQRAKGAEGSFRKDKGEIEALNATIEKMKLDFDASLKKKSANELRLSNLIRDLQQRNEKLGEKIKELGEGGEKLVEWVEGLGLRVPSSLRSIFLSTPPPPPPASQTQNALPSKYASALSSVGKGEGDGEGKGLKGERVRDGGEHKGPEALAGGKARSSFSEGPLPIVPPTSSTPSSIPTAFKCASLKEREKKLEKEKEEEKEKVVVVEEEDFEIVDVESREIGMYEPEGEGEGEGGEEEGEFVFGGKEEEEDAESDGGKSRNGGEEEGGEGGGVLGSLSQAIFHPHRSSPPSTSPSAEKQIGQRPLSLSRSSSIRGGGLGLSLEGSQKLSSSFSAPSVGSDFRRESIDGEGRSKVEEEEGRDKSREGRRETLLPDGRRVISYRNGTQREVWTDGSGRDLVRFPNGDTKFSNPHESEGGVVVYFHCEAGTTHTKWGHGKQKFEFSNGQTEIHSPDGSKEVHFPDGTWQRILRDGSQESYFPDGVVVREGRDGSRVVSQRED